MHLSAVLHALEALLWCGVIFLSLCGHGAALLRAARFDRPPLAFSATAGIAFAILTGGLLNLAHAVTPLALCLFLTLGLALLLIFVRPGHAPAPSGPTTPAARTLTTLLLVLFAAVLALRLFASVHIDSYQNGDDYAFYLAAPKKMLELHTYAPDPFSERRIINTIGGSYFLQDLLLLRLPLEDLQLADRFPGLLLLAMLGFTLARELRLSRAQAAFLALTLVLVPQLMFNLTLVVLPSALFLAMVAIAASRTLRDRHPLLQALLLGAAAGAVISAKSSYIVHATLLVLAFSLLRWWMAGPRAGLRMLSLATLSALVVLAPWMIANHAASGTFFYPIFGHGYHYSAYHILPSPSTLDPHLFLHKILPFTLVLAFFAVLQALITGSGESERAPLMLSIVAVAGCLVLGVATGGDSIRRYNYPAIVPALLLIFVTVSVRVQRSPSNLLWRSAQLAAATLSLLLAVYIGFNSWTHEYATIAHSLHDTLTDRPIVPPQVAASYAAVERALPADAPALVTTHYNFLFDFRARSLYLADFAGAAGPPPGWPAFQSGDALAHYLLTNGVRYVVFEYNFSDFAPGADETHQAVDPNVSRILRNEALLGMNAHRQYRELALTRRKLYDDGETCILDLATPACPGTTCSPSKNSSAL